MKKISKEREIELLKLSDEVDALGVAKDSIPATPGEEAKVEKGLGLQMISIRLPTDTVSQLKQLAADEGLGYQPYIRRLLVTHVKYGHSTDTRASAARKA